MGVRVALVPEEHADVARLHDSGPSSPQGVALMQSIMRRLEVSTNLKDFIRLWLEQQTRWIQNPLPSGVKVQLFPDGPSLGLHHQTRLGVMT